MELCGLTNVTVQRKAGALPTALRCVIHRSIREVKEVAQATQLANGNARIQTWSVSDTLRLCARHTAGL